MIMFCFPAFFSLQDEMAGGGMFPRIMAGLIFFKGMYYLSSSKEHEYVKKAGGSIRENVKLQHLDIKEI